MSTYYSNVLIASRPAIITTTYNIAIICAGHINKNEGAKSVYRGLGSIDITAAFRFVLEVFSTNVPGIRGIRSRKSNYDQFERNPLFATLDNSGRIQFLSEDEYLEIAKDPSENYIITEGKKSFCVHPFLRRQRYNSISDLFLYVVIPVTIDFSDYQYAGRSSAASPQCGAFWGCIGLHYSNTGADVLIIFDQSGMDKVCGVSPSLLRRFPGAHR